MFSTLCPGMSISQVSYANGIFLENYLVKLILKYYHYNGCRANVYLLI